MSNTIIYVKKLFIEKRRLKKNLIQQIPKNEKTSPAFKEIIVYINLQESRGENLKAARIFEPVNNFFIFVWDHVIFLMMKETLFRFVHN